MSGYRSMKVDKLLIKQWTHLGRNAAFNGSLCTGGVPYTKRTYTKTILYTKVYVLKMYRILTVYIPEVYRILTIYVPDVYHIPIVYTLDVYRILTVYVLKCAVCFHSRLYKCVLQGIQLIQVRGLELASCLRSSTVYLVRAWEGTSQGFGNFAAAVMK